MHLWVSLYTLIKPNGTSITFVFVLFLRKRLSCLVERAAYHAGGNASGVGKRFAHERFANTQFSRTCSLTPPSNRLKIYDSRLSVQAAAVTPVVSPVVLLGESACSAASTAPSPAACSNELLEILNGLDAHTVEVDDAVSLHLDSEYGLL